MIDLVAVVVVVVIAMALYELVAPWARRKATQAGLGPPRPARSGGREWDSRRDQVYRSLKGVGGPEDPREEIIAFLDTHDRLRRTSNPGP